MLSPLYLDSPFSPSVNEFLHSLLLFPSHCYRQQSAASSTLLSLLSVVLHHPLSLNWFLNPRSFAAQTALSSSALPYPHPRTPITHRHRRQTNPAEFCLGFVSSQGFGCCSTCKRRSIILHSRLRHTIKAEAQKQTSDEQMWRQDLLLLTQLPDYYTMPTHLCKLLLSDIRRSPAFNTTCFRLSHLHRDYALLSVSSCQVENGWCMQGCPAGSTEF